MTGVKGLGAATLSRASTVADLVDEASARLRAAGIDGARSEARWLLARLFGATEADVLAHDDRPVSPADAARYLALVGRRAAHEPFAYLVGEREFYGRRFLVDRRVLVPRPETEILIEAALDIVRTHTRSPSPAKRGRGLGGGGRESLLIVDVGTGSGAIACTLALDVPGCRVVACDVSADALAVAAANRRRLGLDGSLALVRGSLLDWLGAPADLVVANLPYIPSERVPDLMPEVSRWEPHLALDGGPDGTDLMRRLLADASRIVRPGGSILLELDPGQAAPLQALLPQAAAGVIRDLAGLERVLRLDLL